MHFALSGVQKWQENALSGVQFGLKQVTQRPQTRPRVVEGYPYNTCTDPIPIRGRNHKATPSTP